MSRVYRRGNRLWLDYRGMDGKRHRRPTPFVVGQEQQARELLREVEAQVQAGLAPQAGPKTLTWYARRWYVRRKEQGVDWKNDRSRMEIHVLPALGDPLQGDGQAEDRRSNVQQRRRQRRYGTRKGTIAGIFNDYQCFRASPTGFEPVSPA